MAQGWHRFASDLSYFRGDGNYRIDAYSEFMPPPRVGLKAYGNHTLDSEVFEDGDPFGWHVNEFQEASELLPGLEQIGKQVIGKLARLIDGDPHTTVLHCDLLENHFWPPELAAEPKLPQERCVTLLPIAVSRTQDDKGRVTWTLFGNSEQGPGKAFWKSFFTAPNKEVAADQGIGFFSRLLRTVYGEHHDNLREVGFRILPDPEPLFDFWNEGPLPSWAEPLVLGERQSLAGVKYLLTFRPFGRLPAAVQKAYLDGSLCLLPFPGSLVFWGKPTYHRLYKHLPLALQIPLLFLVARHRTLPGMRVPQSGYIHEPNADNPQPKAHANHVRNTYKRTHRWDKILRDQDELALLGREDKLLHVLFSTIPDDLSLYDKPMARNVQLWFDSGELLLDGPNATPAQLKRAMQVTQAGGLFGYRFLFPAMRVGRHEVFWHRPLVGYRNEAGEPVVLRDAPLGYLTAYDTNRPRLDKPIELWPRVRQRSLPHEAISLYQPGNGHVTIPIIRNVRKLFEAFRVNGDKPLSRSLASHLLSIHRGESLETWVESLANPKLATELHAIIEPEARPLPAPPRRASKTPASLTYDRTAKRSFEVNYWKTIAFLSEGTLLNKNNADCIRDEMTQKLLTYHGRQLENVGDYLLAYYEKVAAAAKMTGKALVGEIPFQWRTDFDYSWMGGWLKNQTTAAERDIVMVIPGKDRSRAVIMSDHYDTAYMADRYEKSEGGCGARLSACGADDNHSATAAMMLAAPIFLDMSKKGKLGCDIWLVHLTGEEFPADCLGARALTQRLIEGTLKIHPTRGKPKDFSKVQVQGLYVSDMIAHNNDRERDIFQISPGADPVSFWLAEQAHIASEIWNASVPEWNSKPDRAGRPRGRRSPHGAAIPEIAPFLRLCGQVRTVIDPRSTLYNTDAQIFSDAGVPVVLFMENYDINRRGYHDTHDTMENIDLDYGAALCAITIESVARAATEKPPR